MGETEIMEMRQTFHNNGRLHFVSFLKFLSYRLRNKPLYDKRITQLINFLQE